MTCGLFDRIRTQIFPFIMIGTKLAHYEIPTHLGSGGMGDVYQATDTKLGRSVAIKFLPEAFSHDSERIARFQREARVLASHLTIFSAYPPASYKPPLQSESRYFPLSPCRPALVSAEASRMRPRVSYRWLDHR